MENIFVFAMGQWRIDPPIVVAIVLLTEEISQVEARGRCLVVLWPDQPMGAGGPHWGLLGGQRPRGLAGGPRGASAPLVNNNGLSIITINHHY